MENHATVYVIDDDSLMRNLIARIVGQSGYFCKTYSTAKAFIESYSNGRGCLISDVQMPEMDGLELLESLQSYNILLPCILITGHGDVPSAVRAMKSNAVDFLQKPFQSTVLLERIDHAIDLDRATHRQKEHSVGVGERLKSLTTRETEVLEHVIDGAANKTMAYQMDLSTKTIELHRRNLMRKMNVDSVAELVRVVTEYQLSVHQSSESTPMT